MGRDSPRTHIFTSKNFRDEGGQIVKRKDTMKTKKRNN